MSGLVSGALTSKRRVGLTILLVLSAAVVTGFTPRAPGSSETANAVDPKPGIYKGKTKQGKNVRFRVKNGKVKRPRFTIDTGACVLTVSSTASDEISPSGRFLIDVGEGTELSWRFKGRFVTNRRVKGRVTIWHLSNNPYAPSCGVKSTRYTARHK